MSNEQKIQALMEEIDRNMPEVKRRGIPLEMQISFAKYLKCLDRLAKE